MSSPAELLPGTLDLLILKAVSLGPQHGYGVLMRIEEISRGGFNIEQGALYPALYRLERKGFPDGRLLAEGKSVTVAALDCGYSSVSAFIAAFKSTFGYTPGRL